mgnify:FL=1
MSVLNKVEGYCLGTIKYADKFINDFQHTKSGKGTEDTAHEWDFEKAEFNIQLVKRKLAREILFLIEEDRNET